MEQVKDFFEGIGKFLEYFGINVAIMFAGAIGSFVSMGQKKNLGFAGRFTAIVSGGAVAHYLTPLVIGWMDLSEGSKYGFAFLLGFSGLEGVKWLIITLKAKYLKIDEKDEDEISEN